MCSDEGFYRITVTSNCGSNPAESKMVVIAEPRPGDSTTFCTTMHYYGSSSINLFYTEWHLGNEMCSNHQLCTNDDGDDDGVPVGNLGWPQLTYQLSNFSLEFLDLMFYNSSELIYVSTDGRRMDVICHNVKCEMAIVWCQVPAEGLYHMCYSFSSVVQHNGSSLNCTEVTRVVANECKSYIY